MQLKTPPQNILSTLLALRDYYAPLVEEYERLYTQAKDNLNHVEALLANWPAKSSEQMNRLKPEQVAAAVTANEKRKDALNGNQNNLETETNLTQNVETEYLSLAQEEINVQLEIPQLDVTAVETTSSYNSNAISEAETTAVESHHVQENLSLDQIDDTLETQEEQEETNDAQQPVADIIETYVSSVDSEDNEGTTIEESATVAQEDLSSDNDNKIVETEDVSEAATDNVETESSLTATENEHQQPQSTSSEQENAQQTQDKQRSLGEIPMLEEYFGLSRIEAVEKLLQKHQGNICHVDFVARALYAELEPSIWKIVRGRVQSTLTQGKNSGRWFLVPGKSGYYTINLKLLKSNRKSSSSKQRKENQFSSQTKPNTISLLPEFEGQYLIDAIATLLEKNQGKILNVVEVVNGLYGEINAEDLKDVRSKIVKELSRGYRTGLFSRIPGEIGLYTWDSKLISSGK